MTGSLRYLRMAMAVIAGLALVLTSITMASAASGHAGQSVHVGAAASLAPTGIPAAAPIIIPVYADISGLVGYAICLYRSNNHCVSDTADKADTNVIIEVLNTVSDGITVWTVIKAAHKSYKWIKKYLYKGKHLYTAAGDGRCMADFAYDQKAELRSCGDRHGIYWQEAKGKLFNTYARGDLIASSLKSGTRLFVHSAKDWSTWTLRSVCVNKC
jgi:hypothetical protein